MSDQKLEEIVSEYAILAKDDNIDVAGLMLNALQQQDENKVSTKAKRWAYLISLGVPPLGIGFAAYYYFSTKSDGKTTAYVCLALTALTIIASVIFFNLILSGSGTSVDQIKTIKPADVFQLTQ